MLNVFPLRIDVVEDHIRIPLVAGGEDHHLIVFIHQLKAFFCEGPYVKSRLKYFAGDQGDIQMYVWGPRWVLLSNAVSQGLVKVKNDSFLDSSLG